ncbi:MAG: alpha/beta hydrolase-fold protein [Acidobacteriota bacterium]
MHDDGSDLIAVAGSSSASDFRQMTDPHRYAPTGSEHTLTGNFRMHPDFRSQFLAHDRNLLVYLPPGYEHETNRRYPVFYLHDGQNLFDGATSYVFGQEWGVDETVEALVSMGEIEPLIVVGIYNTGENRLEEYTPTFDSRFKKGGQAHSYGRMLVEEIKPMIDGIYRTLPGPDHTGLGGSSLGGLVSMHLALKYPTVYGKLMAMSPSVWWDRGMIIKQVQALRVKPSTRVWLDIGTREGKFTARNVRDLRDALSDKGWRLGDDLSYFEAKNALHNELAWGRRVDQALRFLFPRS